MRIARPVAVGSFTDQMARNRRDELGRTRSLSGSERSAAAPRLYRSPISLDANAFAATMRTTSAPPTCWKNCATTTSRWQQACVRPTRFATRRVTLPARVFSRIGSTKASAESGFCSRRLGRVSERHPAAGAVRSPVLLASFTCRSASRVRSKRQCLLAPDWPHQAHRDITAPLSITSAQVLPQLGRGWRYRAIWRQDRCSQSAEGWRGVRVCSL